MISVVIALIILAVLILVHEWGHFIVAKSIGIPIYEFSLGFGRQLYSIRRQGILYSLRLIPMGGYVRMAGEEPGDMNDPNGYNHRRPWEKMVVAFSGPFMNVVLAVLIFIYTFAVIGVPQPVTQAVIGEVVQGKPAAEAGLQEGDRIIQVDDTLIYSWSEFTDMIKHDEAGAPLQVTVERGDGTKVLTVRPLWDEQAGYPIVGVYPQIEYVRQNVGEALKMGFVQTYQTTLVLLAGLVQLFTGAVASSELAGPVGITRMIGEAAQGGMLYLLSFTAFLSINLGIINLLPIPALDGSRIVFAVVEALRRKPLDPEKEGMIHWLGFVFLILIILFATYNDLVRLFKG